MPNYNSGLVAATQRTTDWISADQENFDGRGVKVILDVTNAGTGSITLTLKWKDPGSGKYLTMLAGAAVTTNSTNIYTVYPGATPVANQVVSDACPRTWRAEIKANNANPMDYTLACVYLV